MACQLRVPDLNLVNIWIAQVMPGDPDLQRALLTYAG